MHGSMGVSCSYLTVRVEELRDLDFVCARVWV